jgi:hypothetical protein
MKTNSLLFIASLAVLTSSVSAATTQIESEQVVLPTYVVTAPRYQPVEQQINASLKEFSRQAGTPMTVAPELTVVQAQTVRHNPVASAATAPLTGLIAKS